MLIGSKFTPVNRSTILARDVIPMPDLEFPAVAAFIAETTGIEFKLNKKYLLENRLSPRLKELGCKTYKDYILYLKYDQTKKEFHKLTTAITINETSFLRNPPQLEAFQNIVLPKIIQAAKSRIPNTIKIWSAGCSSGEEPYSLGLLSMEKYPGLSTTKQLQILATDIDDEIIAKASKGHYGQLTLRNLSPHQLNTFFKNNGTQYEINQNIRSLVKFSNLNLSDSARMRLLRDIDVIFFRNVMIYFGTETRKKIISNMYDSLRPGGYLFLGHSESLHGISKAFKLTNLGKSMVYYKEL
ncbi:MAG: protein-glutamate O-methyltransferase CheR [Deferribacteres bacterium]|nr:protein-glutamate O-methyltransferase CheR [candidate division KSB1 bacterium]MCB9501911.1 protein-glutamate O-methyltransferase CheR [Deferribacteres bacterium]